MRDLRRAAVRSANQPSRDGIPGHVGVIADPLDGVASSAYWTDQFPTTTLAPERVTRRNTAADDVTHMPR